MNVAIVGAGFVGLAAGYHLVKKGHKVTIFEKDASPGGLAVGFREKSWQWSLEHHYHHWFTNDDAILQLAKEIEHEVFIRRPKTSVLVGNHPYRLDSPFDVLTFSKLNVIERLRMGMVLGFLKYNPFWKPLERYRVCSVLPKLMGDKPYEMLWEPLLIKKFAEFADEISLAWFWARIAKRTPTLAYPREGFLAFAEALVSEIEKRGGKILFNTEVKDVNNLAHFDKIIVTVPSFLFIKIAPHLPYDYKKRLLNLKGLGAINLILRLKKPFLKDGTYWLNICDKQSPIMAIVEHTNFIDKKYYNNEHIVYLGNYVPADHPFMKMNKKELLAIYTPYLKKINPNFELLILPARQCPRLQRLHSGQEALAGGNFELFKVPFAQPIIPTNYSKVIPPFETPLKNVYLVNIQQVYPWDRGTNYAVALGEEVANRILNETR